MKFPGSHSDSSDVLNDEGSLPLLFILLYGNVLPYMNGFIQHE